METLGVGLIGCGNISESYLRLAPMFRGFEIRAVADLNREAAQARAAAYGLRAESVDDLLAAEDIDIVVNLTVPAAHFEITCKALAAGKHVYSEKPFALSLEEGREIKHLAGLRGRVVGSAPDTFLGGAHQQARAMIDEGQLGRITSGTAFVMSHGMEDWHPNPDFFFRPGAGPMLDLGPYYITNLVQLLGPVARVGALTATPSPTRVIGSAPRRGEEIPVSTPTTIHALLEFAQGAVITLVTSWDVWRHDHAPMALYGETGTLDLPDPNFFGGALCHAPARGAKEPVSPWDHPFGLANDGAQANYRTAGLADMADGIRAGRAPRCGLDLALHVVEVMTGALRAGEVGEFLIMKTTCDRPAPLPPEAARALLLPRA